MTKWCNKQIRDLGRVVTGKTPPKNETHYFDGDELFVSPKDLDWNQLYVTQTETRVSQKALNKFRNQIIPKNAVMFTSLSFGFGKMGIASRPSLTNQQINSVIVNEQNDFRFVYYLLKACTPYIFTYNSGIDTPIVPKSVFERIQLKCPELTVQRRIAAVLWTYDQLIENNKRRIALLQKLAQEIYHEWFVRLRFPSNENVKSFRRVPKGWREAKLAALIPEAGLKTGKRPKGGAQEFGVASIGAENVTKLAEHDFAKEKYVSEEFFESMRQGHVQDRDILFYKDGAEIGRVTLVQDGFPHEKCCVNEHVFLLRTQNLQAQYFLYFYLAQPVIQEYVKTINKNAAQPGINKTELRSIPIVLPPDRIVAQFEKFVSPIIHQIFHLAKSRQVLANSRDLLIPRVISGKLSVESLEIHFPPGLDEELNAQLSTTTNA